MTHIYISVGARDLSGEFIDPRSKKPSKVMNYRGESGPDDDPKSFAVRLNKKGHSVLATDDPLPPSSIAKDQFGNAFIVQYPACFSEKLPELFPELFTS
jgi:hypothetical protein